MNTFKWGWIWDWKRIHKTIKVYNRPLTKKEQSFTLEHLGLANLLASKYTRFSGSEFDDLYQEAVIGLMRASKTYDPEKTKPTTYSSFWIRARMMKYVKELEIVNTPNRVFDARQSVQRENKNRIQNREHAMDTASSIEFLSERYDLNQKRATKLFKELASTPHKAMVHPSVTSADDRIEKENEMFGSCEQDTSFIERQQLSSAVASLKPRVRMIIQRRFGLCNKDHEVETLHEIGESLDPPVTRERVRQIIAEACEQMRPMVER